MLLLKTFLLLQIKSRGRLTHPGVNSNFTPFQHFPMQRLLRLGSLPRCVPYVTALSFLSVIISRAVVALPTHSAVVYDPAAAGAAGPSQQSQQEALNIWHELLPRSAALCFSSGRCSVHKKILPKHGCLGCGWVIYHDRMCWQSHQSPLYNYRKE